MTTTAATLAEECRARSASYHAVDGHSVVGDTDGDDARRHLLADEAHGVSYAAVLPYRLYHLC